MDLSVSDAPVGRLLDGRYRVEALLARGGMATVYRALDTRLDRTVALKIMHAELAADDDFVARFITEARAAARLSDPNIVGVFDQGEDEGAVFLAMEYVPGRTLRDVLRERGRIEPDLSLEILESVLSALRAAHQADIVHRDVKPENVLISDDGRVKVGDFGVARAARQPGNTTARGLLLGTVNYISPEQALGERATPRSDVYAAGIMLYELLTGHPPHTGATDFVVVRAHIDEPVPPPSQAVSVLPAVDDLVLTATSRDAAERYADAGAFLGAVRLARASIASMDADTSMGKHASLSSLSLLGDNGNDIGSTDGTGPGGSADDDVLGSGAIELANAFYHETSAPPPPPPPPSQTARTRVIGTGPADDDSRLASAGRAAGSLGVAKPDRSARASDTTRAERRAHAQARRRRWRGPIIFFLVLLLTAAVTVGAWWYGSGRWMSTPSLLNLSPEEAVTLAQESGLDAVSDGRDFSERVDAGLVLRTDPGPGEQILRGGTVTLIISQGPERYEVPDLSGMTREQVETTLTDRNLVAEFEESHNPEVDEGEAISQDLDPGDKVRPDSVVTVTMSLGPKPIPIDNYQGQSANEARQALEDAGFVVDATEEFSDDVPAGVVISQQPHEGDGFAGDTVSLVVSKGPEIVEVEVPQVVGQQLKPAEKALKDAGFKVEVERAFSGNRNRETRVLRQEPDGGMAPQGSTVTLYVF